MENKNNKRIRVWLVFEIDLNIKKKKKTLVGCLYLRPCKLWRIVNYKPSRVSPDTAFRDATRVSALDFVTCRRAPGTGCVQIFVLNVPGNGIKFPKSWAYAIHYRCVLSGPGEKSKFLIVMKKRRTSIIGTRK